MGKKLIIAEKPSVATDLQKVIGGMERIKTEAGSGGRVRLVGYLNLGVHIILDLLIRELCRSKKLCIAATKFVCKFPCNLVALDIHSINTVWTDASHDWYKHVLIVFRK